MNSTLPTTAPNTFGRPVPAAVVIAHHTPDGAVQQTKLMQAFDFYPKESK